MKHTALLIALTLTCSAAQAEVPLKPEIAETQSHTIMVDVPPPKPTLKQRIIRAPKALAVGTYNAVRHPLVFCKVLEDRGVTRFVSTVTTFGGAAFYLRNFNGFSH